MSDDPGSLVAPQGVDPVSSIPSGTQSAGETFPAADSEAGRGVAAPPAQPAESAIELPDEARRARTSGIVSWAVTIGIAVLITLLVKAFVLQAYSIPSESMVPTLLVNDRVIVFQLDKDPARGDIVVFNRPPTDPKTSESDPDVLIKRVIGLPGDVVESKDGAVYVNGQRLVEPYLPEGVRTDINAPITVPAGRLLVLGDNRGVSYDGRRFGPIDKGLVIGRAVARIWPLSRLSGL